MKRSEWPLAMAALLAGIVFFCSVGRLWPMIPGNVREVPGDWRAQALALNALIGTDLTRYHMASRLRVDGPALDYVEQVCGRKRAVELIGLGVPLAWHRLTFKEAGNPDSVTLIYSLSGSLLGWERTILDDRSEREPAEEPELLARDAAAHLVGDLGLYRVTERATETKPKRIDRRWTFEREWELGEERSIREHLQIQLCGDRVVKAWRSLVVPGAAQVLQRAHAAPVEGLAAVGFSITAVGAMAAAVVALRRLGLGQARLGPAARLTLIIGGLLACTHALQQARLFELWDPLWPRWLAAGRELSFDLIDDLSVLLPLFFFLIAGDALDRLPTRNGLPGPQRAASLWALGRGRFADPAVSSASVRGFLVGALCGGVLAIGTELAVGLVGARVQLQPRGFFFYALNSSAPALMTVCFFTHIALVEELGYRFFAGTWLHRLSGSRALAILLPGVVYGLCHTAFEFLPPADPLWVRPLLLTSVGCVWGWAFFRFDALTVILSHLTCDLFIFNWPLVHLGGWNRVQALVVISLPLWPAALGWLSRRGGSGPARHQVQMPEV